MGTVFGAEDWNPEDGYDTDPLTIEEMDDRWIQFYLDRTLRQIEVALAEG